MSVRTVAVGTLVVGLLAIAAVHVMSQETGIEQEPPTTVNIGGTGGHKVKIIVKSKKIGDPGLPAHWIVGPQNADVVIKITPWILKGLANSGDSVVFSAKPPVSAPKGISISCSIEVDGGERHHAAQVGQDAIDNGILCSTTV